jgi:hypothetical protein
MKNLIGSKPGYANITCSNIEQIHYKLIFTTKFNENHLAVY